MFSTLIFISNIISVITQYYSDEDNLKAAKLRLVLMVIMSLTWPLVFLLW